MLTSRNALKFFHARLFGPTEVVYDNKGLPQTRFSHINRHKECPLSFKEAADVKTYLEDLAEVVTLEFGLLPDSLHGTCVRGRREVIRRSRPGKKQRTGRHKSTITVNEEHLFDLDLIHTLAASTLRTWVVVAATLCHEVCHAVHFAASVLPQTQEPFFEADAFAELGFAFEVFVFGGFIEALPTPDGELKLGLRIQSAEEMAKQYAQLGYYVPTIGEAGDTAATSHTFVNDEWIERLFDDEYWLTVVESDDGQSLRD
jgi:hypothetical protein